VSDLDLRHKNVLVVGLGRSGVGAARLCAARGARVFATDRKRADELGESVHELEKLGVTLELGGHSEPNFRRSDLIVLSPGVPELPELESARRAGVPVLGELELSYRFVQAPVIGITGTNGKSTVTSLLGAMVAASGRATFVGGNLGAPLCEAVGTPAAGPDGALVLELSSFQLETVETFHAQVALLLNLTEDHLDRYATYADYVAAKARLFERQTVYDSIVVNGMPDQQDCLRLVALSPARVAAFAVEPAPGISAWLEGSELCLKLPGGAHESVPRAELKLAGLHNVQNALAALLGARLFGVDLATCRRAMHDFRGLPHRMELCAEVNGIPYYDDSKATNVGSVVGSLTGFERKIVLIAGGKDKGGDYGPMVPILRDVARHLILIGAAADKMQGVFGGVLPTHRALDLPAAVKLASTLVKPGEAVVLSPACSSYDMFKNYEERGRVFAAAARALGEKP
jgi:UDP-N-acetylmuramoylalanine--D-glutamate ligase